MRVITKDQLKERGRAGAVFLGIALGAVAGFEMIIGGGFDPITPSIMYGETAAPTPQPAAVLVTFEEPARATAPDPYTVAQTTYDMAAPDAHLAGGADGREEAIVHSSDDAALRHEIDRLYAESGATIGAAEEYSFADSDVATSQQANWR